MSMSVFAQQVLTLTRSTNPREKGGGVESRYKGTEDWPGLCGAPVEQARTGGRDSRAY